MVKPGPIFRKENKMKQKVEIRVRKATCSPYPYDVALVINGRTQMTAVTSDGCRWSQFPLAITKAKKIAKVLGVKYSPKLIYHDRFVSQGW